MKIRERQRDSIRLMRLIIFFFLFSRISSNNPVREKCRIYAMIQLGHKNCGSNRAVRTMEKQLDWPFWRSQNPACQASLLSLVLRSAYFSFFFLLLFFFFFLYATIIEWGMARDRPWKYRAWFVIYAISVVPFPFRFFSSPFCLLLVKFCFTSINHAMIIYEESSI